MRGLDEFINIGRTSISQTGSAGGGEESACLTECRWWLSEPTRELAALFYGGRSEWLRQSDVCNPTLMSSTDYIGAGGGV